ncbi:hypothetical protein HN873_000380 [Arachis hypogaea]
MLFGCELKQRSFENLSIAVAEFIKLAPTLSWSFCGPVISTMTDSSSTYSTPVTESDVVSATNNVYICLITLELGSIAIKYQGLTSNPFQEHIASLLIFLVATFCHVVGLKATNKNLLATIIRHFSGVIACEALLLILVAQLFRCIIINILISLVVLLNYYEDVRKLVIVCFERIFKSETWSRLSWKGSNTANQSVNSASQEGLYAEETEIQEFETRDMPMCAVVVVNRDDSCFGVQLIPLFCYESEAYTASNINGAQTFNEQSLCCGRKKIKLEYWTHSFGWMTSQTFLVHSMIHGTLW